MVENRRQSGLAIHPAGPRYHTLKFFLLQKAGTSTSKHSRDTQIFSPHFTCLFSSPQDRLNASSKVKEVYDIGLYRLPLYLQYGQSYKESPFILIPRTHPNNDQVVPPSVKHITSMACTGTDFAPLPSLITYQGAAGG